MPQLDEHYETWIGRMLADVSGSKIGKIDDVYTDDDTGQPEWLAVTTGVMGSSMHFVPMRGATVCGGFVQVPYPRDQVKVAPGVGAGRRLSRMEKGRLYAHYGYSYAEERNRLQRALGADPPALTAPGDGGGVSRPADLRHGTAPSDGLDLSRPTARRDETEPPPCEGPDQGRGRWPDDEAIFGLSQEAAAPILAASGGRRRG